MENNNIYQAVIEKRNPNKMKRNNINTIVMERTPMKNVMETNNIYYDLMETKSLKKN